MNDQAIDNAIKDFNDLQKKGLVKNEDRKFYYVNPLDCPYW